jgi:ankyrin repeat protein
VAEQGKISLLEALIAHQATLNVYDKSDLTPAAAAIMQGHIQAAEVLLDAGSVIDASALLLLAARQGLQDRDVVRFLIQQGADPEVKDVAGNTALLIAIQQHNHRLVAHLLAQGADVNTRNAQGQSPLALAQQQQLETIQHRLRRYGAHE